MSWLSDIASLVYPRVCHGCGNALYKHEHAICNRCYIDLPRSNYHLMPNNPVQKIFYGRAEIKQAASFLLFQKKGSVQKLLHALKYRAKPEVGHILGKWYAQDLEKANVFTDCDVIIPVPLHKKRQRKRGYNQSELIACGLSEQLNIPVLTDVLHKKHFTETQTFKSREERWQNTLHSFELKDPSAIFGKKVLLVDDVITTGATTEACIYQLNNAGCSEISVASIAYTL